MYQPLGNLKEIIKRMQEGKYVLPAIQRDYVWKQEQVCHFFDSLMRGFPVGVFLFWELNEISKSEQKYFRFISDYEVNPSQKRDPVKADEIANGSFAVLDGQQRLTSIFISLSGSYRPKKGSKNFLYLNLLWKGENSDQDDLFKFDFFEDGGPFILTDEALWLKVSEILKHEHGYSLWQAVSKQLHGRDQAVVESATDIANILHEVVNKKHTLTSFVEQSETIDNILQIFVRMNSGGTALSHSDLLLSTAVMRWKANDARRDIQNLVNDINSIGNGFNFDKDFVLKTGLLLAGVPVKFKVDTFSKENMEKLDASWNDIKGSIKLAVEVIASFGLNGKNMRANAPVSIVAYYLHETHKSLTYASAVAYKSDRDKVRDWVLKALLKRSVWSDSIDGLLTSIRDSIKGNCSSGFPAECIESALRTRGKSFRFVKSELNELMELDYGKDRTMLVLSLLFPYVDFKHKIHVDHFYPLSRLTKTKLKDSSVSFEEAAKHKNKICNLLLLQGGDNQSKNGKLPSAWLDSYFKDDPSREHFKQLNAIPNVPSNPTEFIEFCTQRREILLNQLTIALK